MEIAFSAGAWRAWKRLPKGVQERLRSKLLEYSNDPRRYAVKLTDPRLGQYRFRIGDYRVVFDLTEQMLQIVAVGHRKDIYR